MLSRIEELKLVALCMTADSRHAFGRLVEEYQQPLRRFLLNLTSGDADLADDVAQEAFLKAYTSLRSFRGLSRFGTWLYRIAYNEWVSQTRRRREELTGSDSPPPDVESYTPSAADDARLDVSRAIAALSEPERTVVLLFYMEDRPIKDIVTITGFPEGTVKSHLSRAKVKMAKVFDD
ncbi:MAG: RNA polymerase sigma factor [Pseudoflavonifractor sp.]|nr:RNA polymerase sigma factor [Pseudoflavonifractor sp.]